MSGNIFDLSLEEVTNWMSENPPPIEGLGVRVTNEVLHNDSVVGFFKNGALVGRFMLAEMVGCCAIVLSTETSVMPRYANKGMAQYMLRMKEYIAGLCGYSMLIATVISINEQEIHILEKFDWIRHTAVYNRRTGNTILVYTKHLYPEDAFYIPKMNLH
jgi:hypothetical protein